MANTHLSDRFKTYAISYGFLGGNLVGRTFRKFMTSSGYRHLANLAEADIIVAHSAGCWCLPDKCRASLIILVGLPLAEPGRATSIRSNRSRTLGFIKNKHFFKGLEITLLNFYYATRQPRRNLGIIRNAKELQTSLTVPEVEQVVTIVNQYDPWPSYNRMQRYMKTENWSFISLPGSHDDIWEHSERYVSIINHYARILA